MTVWKKAILFRVRETPGFDPHAMAAKFGHKVSDISWRLEWLKLHGYVAGTGFWRDGVEDLTVTGAGLEALHA